MEDHLVRQVEKMLIEEDLLQKGDHVVVALSGGPDSVALLHILHRLSGSWRLELTAAHVNHGFRPEESRQEAEQAAQWVASLGVPFETITLDLPAYIRETGRNGQDAARELRYRFLLETAHRVGAGKIAFAHHADDQAETVLMRLLRGTGPTGLVGIPMKRSVENVELFRPLLRINKKALVDYCMEHGLPYSIDSSNEKRIYTRNRIRLDALPYLSGFNPRLADSLGRLAQTMEAEDGYLQSETEKLFARIAEPCEDGWTFSQREFAGLHLALQRRLIKLILNYLSSESASGDASGFVQTELIRKAALEQQPPNLTLDVGGGALFRREYDRLSIARHRLAFRDARSYEIEAGDGDLFVSETGVRFTFRLSDRLIDLPENWKSNKTSAVFDMDDLSFPLCLRTRQEGDRIRIPGLNGSKKVKDVYIEEKVPQRQRSRLPVLTDAEGRILWLPGYRRSAYSVVTEKTRRYFYAEAHFPEVLTE
ncbi:tRNA lysidine(34) synthetase TilS [Gorillibacterium massiliense]|uniref:tRNA lysidine(34) synthetase TilS n=1 Tax=Gorillibacterium massiliense TaxID=1280390 RepID=UPI000693225D|nr:tRNA lysidine(34) synthetase TilS [Gorillibacterium massiliense]